MANKDPKEPVETGSQPDLDAPEMSARELEEPETRSLEEMEAIETAAEEGGRDAMSDAEAAVEEGTPYTPPQSPPVEPGGEDDAYVPEDEIDAERLERLVLDALASDPTTSSLDLEVAVAGTTAVLTGAVDAAADAETALAVALSVDGVDRVVDRIEVLED